MREIGKIKMLQIQTGSLKQGKRPESYYDPRYILAVPSMLLTPEGALGVTAEAEKIVDIHNARHPDTHNNGTNPITIGFTTHYATMREQYGAHMKDGIAGENVIIEADSSFTWDDLVKGVAIQNADGTVHQFRLLKIAEPCVEFSHFAAGKNAAQGNPLGGIELKETLQFLSFGRRGFHISPLNDREPVAVAMGDTVFIVD
jgi:hypothetical protein